jgi:RND family efflux transporter MFP subunit
MAVAAGCGRHGKEAPKGGTTVPPSQTKLKRNVDLAQVQVQNLPSEVETVGYLDAEGQTDIAAGVTGVVDEVLFREGQWVDKDTILVKVDQKRYLAAAEVARANEVRAESNLDLAKVREKISTSAGIGTSAEDKAMTSGAAKVAAAELASARAARILAEHNLFRSQVRAPYAGQINQRRITPGTYLEEKTVIGTIADVSRLRLVGFIPEKAAPMVRQMVRQEEQTRTAWLLGSWLASPWSGLAASAADCNGNCPASFKLAFTLRPFPQKVFHGRIFYLSTVASPDTHMFECKAEVPAEGSGTELRPGYTAKIRCPLPGRPTSYVIPEESVKASERGFIVFRPTPLYNKDGTVEWVAEQLTVQLGVRKPGFVEVLEGLAPGDWIVRKGAEALENNTPIQFPEELTPRVKEQHEANHRREGR